LNRLIDRIQDAAVLLVITYRPEIEAPWTGQGNVTLHSLNRLGRKHGTDMVARLTGDKVLPVEVLDEIIAKTDGVPLFVEELTRAVIDAGYLKETTNEYVIEGSLPSLAIPTTLQDSLTARLDRLGPIKEVAQIAACIGRRFSYELLSLVAPLNGDALSDALTQLSNKGIISGRGVPPTATYLFKHALVQDAAHESLLMKGRQRAHEAIANALEAHFPDTVTSHPEILAHHYTVADRSNRATPYWLAAGQLAVTRSANQEAIHHLSHGLELVRVTPPSRDRDQLELAFHVALGTPLSALKGHGSTEAGANYERAYEISQSLGESVERTAILYGLWVTSNTRAEHRKALDWADQILAFAADREARVTSMIGHRSRGTTLLYLGNLTAALRELENAVSLYDPQSDADLAYRFVQDPEVASRCLLSWTSWLQGYPDKAAGHSNLAFRRSDEIGHSFTQIWPAFFCGIILRAWLGQESEVEAHLENQLPTLGQNNFWQFTKYYQITKPWIQARRIGQASVERMAHNKSELRRSGMNLYGSLFSGMIAESHLTNGHVDAALGVLDEAQADSDQTHERFMQAELHRIRGECLKSAKSVSNAEESFRTAMSIAIEQGAKSWELRASSSLARLWQMQGKSAEAHDLLAPVYNWFSEGFDTKDLQEAKALLGQLESKRAPH
jgi:predicted ATPase